jgi:hypothetical protein
MDWPESKIVLYPVPADAILHIHTDFAQDQQVLIRIFNLLGREVGTEKANSNEVNMFTASFADGVYILKAESGNKTAVQKFVVRH